MIRVVHPGSGCWLSIHPRSQIQGSKRHRIPDPDPQHCKNIIELLGKVHYHNPSKFQYVYIVKNQKPIYVHSSVLVLLTIFVNSRSFIIMRIRLQELMQKIPNLPNFYSKPVFRIRDILRRIQIRIIESDTGIMLFSSVTSKLPKNMFSQVFWLLLSVDTCTLVFKDNKQCCGSGSWIRCLFDPWIRDPE